MDPVPVYIATAVATALVAAVIALWRFVIVGHRKCVEHNGRLETEIKETKDLLIKRSESDVAKAEARELAAHERSLKFAAALTDCASATRETKEVTRLAIRVLRQYPPRQFNTPIPGSELDDQTPLSGQPRQQ